MEPLYFCPKIRKIATKTFDKHLVDKQSHKNYTKYIG